MTDRPASTPTTKPSRLSAGNAWYVIGCAVSLAYALSVYVPLIQPDRRNLHLDWLLALNVARIQGLAFGREILYTFGPLGFAWIGYFPGQFAYLVIVWSVIGGGLWCSLLIGLRRVRAPDRLILPGITALFVLAAGEDTTMHDCRLLLLPIVLLAYHFFLDDRPRSAGKSILLLALALASLMKFTYLIGALIAVGAVSLDEGLRLRRSFAALIFAGMYLIGWRLIGQRWGSLPAYVASSIDIARGYSDAMARNTSIELLNVSLFAGFALLITALAFAYSGSQALWRRFAHASALLTLLLLVFKAGFVREGEHEIVSTSILPPMALCYMLATYDKSKRRRIWLSAWLVCIGLTGYVASSSYSNWTGENLFARSVNSVWLAMDEVADASRIVTGHASALKIAYEQTVQRIAGDCPLRQVTGSVDLFMKDQRYVVFNGLDYSPRPAVQGYVAYTPRLAEADAEFLRGPRAPQNLFVDLKTIDESLPAMNDSRALLEIISRYELVKHDGTFLQFRRAMNIRPYTLVPLREQSAVVGERVNFPDAGEAPIWAVIDVKTTWIQRMIALLYKPTILSIQITRPGKPPAQARYIRGSGEAGFIISPFLDSNDSFARLCDPAMRQDQRAQIPSSFRLFPQSDPIPPQGGDVLHVKFYRVDFGEPIPR